MCSALPKVPQVTLYPFVRDQNAINADRTLLEDEDGM